MFQITSESVQRWVRVGLYSGFGALADRGIKVEGTWKELITAGVGLLATAAWTMYGSRLNAMLSEIGKIDGVEKAILELDPTKIKPAEVNKATPENVKAVPAQ